MKNIIEVIEMAMAALDDGTTSSKKDNAYNSLRQLRDEIQAELSAQKNQQSNIAGVIARFSNSYGWISYSKFNEWMTERGFDVTELERHNRTDGEVHFKYRHKITAQTFEFNGNYWNGESFKAVIAWLNQNGL